MALASRNLDRNTTFLRTRLSRSLYVGPTRGNQPAYPAIYPLDWPRLFTMPALCMSVPSLLGSRPDDDALGRLRAATTLPFSPSSARCSSLLTTTDAPLLLAALVSTASSSPEPAASTTTPP